MGARPHGYKGECATLRLKRSRKASQRRGYQSWILKAVKDFPRWKTGQKRGVYAKVWRQDTSQSAGGKKRITWNSSFLFHHLLITNDVGDDFNFLITQFGLLWTHQHWEIHQPPQNYPCVWNNLFIQASLLLRFSSLMGLWMDPALERAFWPWGFP